MIPPGPKVTVSLQKKEGNTSDGYGGFTDVWTTVKTFEGVMLPMSGNENIMYAKEVGKGGFLLYTFNIGTAVTVFHRILYGTRIFKILFPEVPTMNTIFQVLYLEEVV